VPELSTADKNLHADHNEAQHLTGQKILKIISNYLFKKEMNAQAVQSFLLVTGRFSLK